MRTRNLTRLAVPAAVLALTLFSATAQAAAGSGDPFLLLLKGIYQPVTNAPNLGLPGVNLNDGSFSVTDIHRVSTVPGAAPSGEVVGRFYVQFNGSLAVYDLPGGAMEMQFTDSSFPTAVPDGQGGVYLEGTAELTVLNATGIYRPFIGGHNHMVDRLHQLASGQLFDESCFCIISLPEALALWWSSN